MLWRRMSEVRGDILVLLDRTNHVVPTLTLNGLLPGGSVVKNVPVMGRPEFNLWIKKILG